MMFKSQERLRIIRDKVYDFLMNVTDIDFNEINSSEKSEDLYFYNFTTFI
jgi:hypothetical protein